MYTEIKNGAGEPSPLPSPGGRGGNWLEGMVMSMVAIGAVHVGSRRDRRGVDVRLFGPMGLAVPMPTSQLPPLPPGEGRGEGSPASVF